MTLLFTKIAMLSTGGDVHSLRDAVFCSEIFVKFGSSKLEWFVVIKVLNTTVIIHSVIKN